MLATPWCFLTWSSIEKVVGGGGKGKNDRVILTSGTVDFIFLYRKGSPGTKLPCPLLMAHPNVRDDSPEC